MGIISDHIQNELDEYEDHYNKDYDGSLVFQHWNED
jgi:hypothetical protein